MKTHYLDTRSRQIDFLVVGAGFSGSVLAERLANDGHSVLIVDKRHHIGGNAYDCYNDDGILIHQYGPHIFHTNSKEVFNYLSQFTLWRFYEHEVLAEVDNRRVPIPINLNTMNALLNCDMTPTDLERYFEKAREPVCDIKTSEDVVINAVGRNLYKTFFRGYTRKQWGVDPSQLDKMVTARIPTRTNRDNRYFTDTYQFMPLNGFTAMFKNMLNHQNIEIVLNTDYRDLLDSISYKKIIYTGPIDAFFNYRYGKLPYRSLSFHHETKNCDVFQEKAVVNFPNTHAYTRITEFKHLTGQVHPKTSIVYEYPQACGDPYYPIPQPENARRYEEYKALANATQNVYFTGRLATYHYYNMDQVIAQALTTYEKITGKKQVNGFKTKSANQKDYAQLNTFSLVSAH